MKVIEIGKIPIKSWASEIEEGALKQAENLSNLSFAFSHIAIMPDVHEGYGMPIGGVLASDGMIVPNAVGVDIGCGVVAVKTDIKDIKENQIRKILESAQNNIPMGYKHHNRNQEWKGFLQAPNSKIIQQELNSAKKQLGTLGGGNHFCSIEKGSDGHIWLMVHSGSRNVGYKTANYYNNLAKKLNEKEEIVPKKYDLASLFFYSHEGKEYFAAMEFCLEFAKENRKRILEVFYSCFVHETKSKVIMEEVDIHHNYAAVENHFGKELVIHRKGATSAKKGQMGIIPGSMGTASYIVEGLGNKESFMSSSHGAGRTISRKKANETIDREAADDSMKGIVFSGWKGDYSEAPMAYKDIEEVMNNQKDLVKPLVRLNPMGVMKG